MSTLPHTEEIGAFIVPVWTKRLGEVGKPMMICYIAGYTDPSKAREAVKRHIEALEGDDIREPVPVSLNTARALNVQPGNVWML